MIGNDNVGVTFVNTVIGRGALNNVVNISFGVFNFTPNENGEVDIDSTVACRLRMDIACATQLRNVLNNLLEAIEKNRSEPDVEKTEGLIPKQASESLN